MFSLFAFLILGSAPEGGMTVLRTFQDPAEVNEDAFMRMPYSFDFSEDGRLYVVDQGNHNVQIWKADGQWSGMFGKQGQGPGELFFPYKIQVTGGKAYVFCRNGQMNVFDLDGKYLSSFKTNYRMARNFAVLDTNLFLFATMAANSATDIVMKVVLADGEGKELSTLKQWPNDMILAPVEGSNRTTIKAYGADIDIQEGADGTYWFGYGAEPILHQIDKKGMIIGQQRYQIPTAKPTDEEQALYSRISFTAMNGQRAGFKDIPTLKINFEHNKAYFCQFTRLKDQTLFFSHAMGGTQGIAFGFSEGTYTLSNSKSGKPVKRGAYRYPEDTRILARNGRVIGLVSSEEGDFSVVELNLTK
ncbi:MAG: 6-bladed beta-propeller [Acidobacteriota bacterium]|nr:6-bladed beta-propeller [Acidobacteriota bacterium]